MWGKKFNIINKFNTKIQDIAKVINNILKIYRKSNKILLILQFMSMQEANIIKEI